MAQQDQLRQQHGDNGFQTNRLASMADSFATRAREGRRAVGRETSTDGMTLVEAARLGSALSMKTTRPLSAHCSPGIIVPSYSRNMHTCRDAALMSRLSVVHIIEDALDLLDEEDDDNFFDDHHDPRLTTMVQSAAFCLPSPELSVMRNIRSTTSSQTPRRTKRQRTDCQD